jgi:hypothetical protein
MASGEKEFRKYLSAAVEQGWDPRPIKSGYQLVPGDPTKEIVTIHRTPSDRRALANVLAEMRRQGFIWPWPQKRGK